MQFRQLVFTTSIFLSPSSQLFLGPPPYSVPPPSEDTGGRQARVSKETVLMNFMQKLGKSQLDDKSYIYRKYTAKVGQGNVNIDIVTTSFPGSCPYLECGALKIGKRPWERGWHCYNISAGQYQPSSGLLNG